MRTPVIAGNWKLNKTRKETQSFIQELAPLVKDISDVEVVLCPPFTALGVAKQTVEDTRIGLGAQNMYWKESGAYTGEISAPLLIDAGCRYVILGHSERRGRFGVPEPDLEGDAGRVFGDNDASANMKLHAALAHDLVPIVCVGETLEERRTGRTDDILRDQTRAAVRGIESEAAGTLIFAYEPVWAIGTGETRDAIEADRVCGLIRHTLCETCGTETAENVRVQYGGSVKPDNAADLLGRPHIDGALVGGASLKADSFAAIVKAAAGTAR